MKVWEKSVSIPLREKLDNGKEQVMLNKANNGRDTGVFGEDGRPDIGHALKILFELFWLLAVGLIGGTAIIVAIIK